MQTVGISFDLQPQFPTPPSAVEIIQKVGEHCNFYVPLDEVAAKITSMANLGGTEQEFRRWVEERSGCDRRWSQLLYSTLSLATLSNGHRQELLDMREVFPYWELSSLTAYCRSHSRLDGIVRRWDDPIWKDIYPPNGWLCGCSVLCGRKEDFPNPPHIRVTQQIREKCRNWLSDANPEETVDLLRPHRKE